MSGSVWKRCGCRDEQGRTFYGSADRQGSSRRCPEIDKPGHGSWAYRAFLGPGIDDRGEWKARRQPSKSGFRTRKEAAEALARLIAEDRGGDRVQVGHKTTGEYLEEWYASKVESGALRPSTALSYRHHLDAYLIPLLGPVRLTELRVEHVERMYSAIRAKGPGGPTKARPLDRMKRVPGPATLRRVHATLMSALNTAVRKRYLLWNPAEHAELPKVTRPKVSPWQPAEVGRFLDVAAHDRLGVLYEMLVLTGLRRGEAVGLRWQDVDLDRAVLFVRQQVTDVGGRLEIGKPKTRSGEDRRVDLPEVLVESLRVHELRQDLERTDAGSAWVETGLVFTTSSGEVLRPDFVTRRMTALAKVAGLPPKRLHDLRHGAASLSLAAGVDIAIVSKRLGHSNIALTVDTYSHLLEGVGRDAAERTAALVPRATPRSTSAADFSHPALR